MSRMRFCVQAWSRGKGTDERTNYRALEQEGHNMILKRCDGCGKMEEIEELNREKAGESVILIKENEDDCDYCTEKLVEWITIRRQKVNE